MGETQLMVQLAQLGAVVCLVAVVDDYRVGFEVNRPARRTAHPSRIEFRIRPQRPPPLSSAAASLPPGRHKHQRQNHPDQHQSRLE
jgi:hypothetical protein